jgi:8-oxo-dGTP pyrophosphatase MutT (NUDIX family)
MARKLGYDPGMLGRIAQITANLAAFQPVALDPVGLRHAAVAIVICPHDDTLHFLLTRRAMTLRRNAGNYALPGGHVDTGEDAVAAAIRETSEELGVTLRRDMVIGQLDDFATLGGHIVTPIVFWCPEPVVLSPNPDEVHLAWHALLDDLDHPESPRPEAHPDGGEPILRMYSGGDWLNPPTAAWLYQFREIAFHGRSTRIDKVGQPNWTAD